MLWRIIEMFLYLVVVFVTLAAWFRFCGWIGVQ